MKNGKALLVISTHIITKGVISEYAKLTQADGYDCLLAIDNTNLNLPFESRVCKKNFFNQEVNCFIFDENIHKELNLPYITYYNTNSSFSKVMWYNADYRYYYINKFFPDYEYYWQFDYDVFCNGKSYMPFLEKYAQSNDDLLITHFRNETKNGKWVWTHDIDWVYDDHVAIHGSLFCISRLSNAAIKFLYQKRLEQYEKYIKGDNMKKQKWLNCEIFVPTELMNNNYTCSDITEKNIRLKEFDINEDRFFENPDDLLYHPVKGNFVKRIADMKIGHICINLLLFKIKIKPNKLINLCK